MKGNMDYPDYTYHLQQAIANGHLVEVFKDLWQKRVSTREHAYAFLVDFFSLYVPQV